MAHPVGLILGLALLGMCAALAPAHAVGFQHRSVPDGGDPPLDVGIWYPSDAPAAPHRLGLGEQTVAPDGAVAGNNLPLVLISHGSGGWFGGHVDTALALARAGFVVAALSHTGDTYADSSRALKLAGRPAQVKRLLDYMLADWPGHARIDPARVGVFGFSAGGFTALVLIGGVPDLARIAPHCEARPEEWTCKLLKAHGVDLATLPPEPASAWVHDARIRAAVIAAPALGFAFGRDGLAHVHVPVQLWAAANDQVLPVEFYAQVVARALPAPPEYHVVPNAGHFAFLAPCSAELARRVPEICKDAAGFDRAGMHAIFNAEVARFFTATLPGP